MNSRTDRWRAAVALIAAVLLLGACGAGSDRAGSGDGSGLDTQSVAADSLPFTGTTTVGKPFDSTDLGGQPTVLWFWAPWCTVCRAEAPDVAAVAARLDGDVAFVGVPGRGPVDDMRQFIAQTGTGDFVHVADTDGSLWSRFRVVSQPSFVFVARDGSAERFTGSLDRAGLRRAAQALAAG